MSIISRRLFGLTGGNHTSGPAEKTKEAIAKTVITRKINAAATGPATNN
jgi:hypothetical protein